MANFPEVTGGRAGGRLRSALVCLTLFAAAQAFSSVVSQAEVLPSGTRLEVRLTTLAGSRHSRPGDPISATVIAPVQGQDRPLFLQGATVAGRVEGVHALGLELKRDAADLRLHFDSLYLSDGTSVPIEGRVHGIETARERVDSEGTIHGISPAANLSSGISFLITTTLIDTELVAPAIAFKLLAVRSPDSEIYLPPGTELLVELTNDVVVETPGSTFEAKPALPLEDLRDAQRLLQRLPRQQTEIDRNHSSDLVNLLLLGTREQVARAFHAAGWSGENNHSAMALYRIYHSLVQRTGYAMCPMTRLTLNGMAANKTYQKGLDTVAKRHHIRLWGQADSTAWLGAASEDVGLTLRRMRITHSIDRHIDNERAKVVNDLWFTGCVSSGSMLPRSSLRLVGDKGYAIATDGDVAVLRLDNCDHAGIASSWAPALDRHVRMLRILSAVGNDIARANPLTVGLVAFRTLARLKPGELKLERAHSDQPWNRLGVFDNGSEKMRAARLVESVYPQSPRRSAN